MTKHALMPGSALACLDASAGELVEAACEKALFATPEAAAAAVAYVTAQLSLLADGSEFERRSGANYESALGRLRHAIETDPLWHRGACACGPGWLHAGELRRPSVAARYQPG